MQHVRKHVTEERFYTDVLYKLLFTFFIFCALFSVCYLTLYA
jgi:hypothetical protein